MPRQEALVGAKRARSRRPQWFIHQYVIYTHPNELANMEWRDMERMLASVFEGLGFRVELTAPSKDGGKDIILECSISGANQSYLVEVKHWRSKQKVDQSYVSHFVDVVANERRHGGLYLATYGYCHDAFEALTEIERSRIYAGDEEKVVSLCRTFVKAESGFMVCTNHTDRCNLREYNSHEGPV